jgi:hypothetical protein
MTALEFDGMHITTTGCVATIKGNKVTLAASCPCGHGEFSLEMDSPKSEILEKLAVNIVEKESNPHGGGGFDIGVTKSRRFDCGRCGREIVVLAKFELSDAEWLKVQKQWSEGTKTTLYKGLITIESRANRGYFGVYDDSALEVRCQNCHSKSALTEAIVYFNQLSSDNASKILEWDSAIEPKTILMRVKCPVCLEELEASCTIGVQKPATAKEFIEVWKLWNPSQSAGVAVPIDLTPPKKSGHGQTGLVTKAG